MAKRKTTRSYAVLLHPDVPKLLLEGLASYVHEWEGKLSYILCTSVDPSGYFVEMTMMVHGSDDDAEDWVFQLPVSYVIGIADMSKRHTGPGFHSK
jgi:hypothetical protein